MSLYIGFNIIDLVRTKFEKFEQQSKPSRSTSTNESLNSFDLFGYFQYYYLIFPNRREQLIFSFLCTGLLYNAHRSWWRPRSLWSPRQRLCSTASTRSCLCCPKVPTLMWPRHPEHLIFFCGLLWGCRLSLSHCTSRFDRSVLPRPFRLRLNFQLWNLLRRTSGRLALLQSS